MITTRIRPSNTAIVFTIVHNAHGEHRRSSPSQISENNTNKEKNTNQLPKFPYNAFSKMLIMIICELKQMIAWVVSKAQEIIGVILKSEMNIMVSDIKAILSLEYRNNSS